MRRWRNLHHQRILSKSQQNKILIFALYLKVTAENTLLIRLIYFKKTPQMLFDILFWPGQYYLLELLNLSIILDKLFPLPFESFITCLALAAAAFAFNVFRAISNALLAILSLLSRCKYIKEEQSIVIITSL